LYERETSEVGLLDIGIHLKRLWHLAGRYAECVERIGIWRG